MGNSKPTALLTPPVCSSAQNLNLPFLAMLYFFQYFTGTS